MMSKATLLVHLRAIWSINRHWETTKRINADSRLRLHHHGSAIVDGRKTTSFYEFDGKVAMVGTSGYSISRSRPTIKLTP